MKLKESETLELKKSTSELKEAVVSITAMLNKHQHCELYFGVKNDGAVIGQGREFKGHKRIQGTQYEFPMLEKSG